MSKSLSNTLLILVAFFVFGFSITANAKPKPSEVEVVNTPDVNVTAMPNVDVATMPAVDVATLPAVDVGTMPDINVASMPDINVANKPDVNVANTSPISVIVTNDSLWREPYSDKAFNDNGIPWADFKTVPIGKRLHVEYLSVWLLIDPGEYMYCRIRVLGGTSSESASHDLLLSASGPASPGGQLYIASTPISFTADEDQYLRLDCSTGDGDPNLRGSITGYLVDLPPQ